jgi:hypothetical protein
MSEPFEERLSRFTPDGTGLDRDALLFAAGRASVRSGRRWAAVAAALAASQVLTLAILWPRSTPPALPPGPVRGPAAARLPQPPAPLDPSALGALHRRMLSADGELPPPDRPDPAAPDGPPLRLGAALRSMLWN